MKGEKLVLSFWSQWIKLQLEHNIERITEQSIKNFHFPGFNYICFDFSPHQTCRLYIVEPEHPLDISSINIHTHLYDSQLLVLHGSILNTTYKLDNERTDYNMYSLVSALPPENKERKIKLKFLGKRGLKIDKLIPLLPGESHFQPHTEIHNVRNHVGDLLAFMVFEFKTVKTTSTIFTKKEYLGTIPTPNAYLKYESEEILNLINKVMQAMDKRISQD